MVEQLVLGLPQKLVLPLPELESFILTYIGFGLLFELYVRFDGYENVREYGTLRRLWISILTIMFWPIIGAIEIHTMEGKLREENLYEELLDEVHEGDF